MSRHFVSERVIKLLVITLVSNDDKFKSFHYPNLEKFVGKVLRPNHMKIQGPVIESLEQNRKPATKENVNTQKCKRLRSAVSRMAFLGMYHVWLLIFSSAENFEDTVKNIFRFVRLLTFVQARQKKPDACRSANVDDISYFS